MFLESGRRQGKCGKILMGSGHISAAQTVVFDQTHGLDGFGVPIYGRITSPYEALFGILLFRVVKIPRKKRWNRLLDTLQTAGLPGSHTYPQQCCGFQNRFGFETSFHKSRRFSLL